MLIVIRKQHKTSSCLVVMLFAIYQHSGMQREHGKLNKAVECFQFYVILFGTLKEYACCKRLNLKFV